MNKKKNLILQLLKLFSLELLRNKLGFLLLTTTPTIFLLIAFYTTKKLIIPIKLYYYNQTIKLIISQNYIHIVYIGAAVLGFLCAYYATVIFQQNLSYYKFCIFSGLAFKYYYLIRMLFLFLIISFISFLICFVIRIIIPINNIIFLCFGLIFTGLIYGSFGGIIGIISKNFMISFLAIILFANLDVGWMQNPLFYTYAKNTNFIRYLPAFFPCQLIYSAAFDKSINNWAFIMSIVYILILFMILYCSLYIRLKGFVIKTNK